MRHRTFFLLLAIVLALPADSSFAQYQSPIAANVPWNCYRGERVDNESASMVSIIGTGGTRILGSGTASGEVLFSLPLTSGDFDFFFVNRTYSVAEMKIDISGFVSFNGAVHDLPGRLFPYLRYNNSFANASSNRLIAVFWSNFVSTGGDQGIYYRVDGTAPGTRVLTLEWKVVHADYPGGNWGFQLQLFEADSSMRFNYADEAPMLEMPTTFSPDVPHGAQVGIKNFGQEVGAPPVNLYSSIGGYTYSGDAAQFLLLTHQHLVPHPPAITRLPTMRLATATHMIDYIPEWYASFPLGIASPHTPRPASIYYHYSFPARSGCMNLRQSYRIYREPGCSTPPVYARVPDVLPFDVPPGGDTLRGKGPLVGKIPRDTSIIDPQDPLVIDVILYNLRHFTGDLPLRIDIFPMYGATSLLTLLDTITLGAQDSIAVSLSNPSPGLPPGLYRVEYSILPNADTLYGPPERSYLIIRASRDLMTLLARSPDSYAIDQNRYAIGLGVPLRMVALNSGRSSIDTAEFTYRIYNSNGNLIAQNSSLMTGSWASMDSIEVNFGTWLPPATGRYYFRGYPNLAGDQITENDTVLQLNEHYGVAFDVYADNDVEVLSSQEGFALPHADSSYHVVTLPVAVSVRNNSIGSQQQIRVRTTIAAQGGIPFYDTTRTIAVLPCYGSPINVPFSNVIAPDVPGTYLVTAWIVGGVDDLPANDTARWIFRVVDTSSSGVKEPNPIEHTRLEIYPNPTTGDATIRCLLPTRMQTSLAVYDINGKRVRSIYKGWIETRRDITFPTDGLPSGTYTIRMTTSDGRVYTTRLTVQR